MSEPTRAVVVTGAASGIGRALAEELGRRGTPLVLCDLDATGLETVREKIGSAVWTVRERRDARRARRQARPHPAGARGRSPPRS